MVGDSDNKFNPKKNITRAEMAVLSVKSYNKLVENKGTETNRENRNRDSDRLQDDAEWGYFPDDDGKRFLSEPVWGEGKGNGEI